ncbi:MAG: Lrp/AsnC family transcriptional regulator [Robiginitomaculum sp.]|nr:Lrp/AsnC family transcriptional regulator [Robiginitomaculum sp.]
MHTLDSISHNILHHLERNGRVSNVELAERVGLSPSACLRRVQELERSGIIKGYKAVIDRSKLGGGFIVFVAVGFSQQRKSDQEAFERAMMQAPEVIECHNVSGSIEYILKVEVADLAAYKKFHTETLGTCPELNSITSYIAMSSPKEV